MRPFCRSLRKVYRPKRGSLPRAALACTRMRAVGGANTMSTGMVYVTFVTELGPAHLTSVVVGGARGNAAFLVTCSAIGSPTSRAVRAKAQALANRATTQLLEALARE